MFDVNAICNTVEKSTGVCNVRVNFIFTVDVVYTDMERIDSF